MTISNQHISHMKASLLFLIVNACIAFLQPLCFGAADVGQSIAGLPYSGNEFGICEANDPISISRGWQYSVRYIHFNPREHLIFNIYVEKTEAGYLAALYSTEELSISSLDAIDPKEKLKYATSTALIKIETAQAVYGAWIKALGRARYGNGVRNASGGGYYISAYALDAGYMFADARESVEGQTTGCIIAIGKLMKQIIEEQSAIRREGLEDRVKKLCGEYLRN